MGSYVENKKKELEKLKEELTELTNRKKEAYKKYYNLLKEAKDIENKIFDCKTDILTKGKLDKYKKYIKIFSAREINGELAVGVHLKDEYKFNIKPPFEEYYSRFIRRCY